MTNAIVLLILVFFGYFVLIKKRSLQGSVQAIQELQTQINQALAARYQTFSDLIYVMDQYMDTEKSTFREVAELEEKAQQAAAAGDIRTRIADEDKISRQVEGVGFAFEQYEGLKNDENAQALFDQLVQQEDELAQLKLACNNLIDTYNNHKNSLFGSMVAFMFGSSLNHRFEQWHVNSDALDSRDKYEIV